MRNAAYTIWITGLSGAGKSTLARALTNRLRYEGKQVLSLDRDELREIFGILAPGKNNFDRECRAKAAMQYSNLCRLITQQGIIVVIATISLFREIHEWNRANLPGYFEVYLKVPLEELRRRDPKGIYRRFDTGQLTNVAGLDLPIDEPYAPHCLIEFKADQSLETVIELLMKELSSRNNT